jgi:hypothetical protein
MVSERRRSVAGGQRPVSVAVDDSGRNLEDEYGCLHARAFLLNAGDSLYSLQVPPHHHE